MPLSPILPRRKARLLKVINLSEVTKPVSTDSGGRQLERQDSLTSSSSSLSSCCFQGSHIQLPAGARQVMWKREIVSDRRVELWRLSGGGCTLSKLAVPQLQPSFAKHECQLHVTSSSGFPREAEI